MSQEQDRSIKSVESMTVAVRWISCPHCDAEQAGWLADPRGRKYKCDECGETYHVPANVDVRVF